MPNQTEVNDKDQHVWRRERDVIYARLKAVADAVGCQFFSLGSLDFENLTTQVTKGDKILSSRLFDVIPAIDTWHQLDQCCQAYGTKLWFVTDNIIDESVYVFKNIKIWSLPELLGVTAYISDQTAPTTCRGRLYNCFMQRCESMRQSWFYFLYLEGLLDKGYVSYLLYQLEDYAQLTGVELFDFIHYNKGLSQLDKFNLAHGFLRSKVPYRNFGENHDLIKYINDSKYSVILETYAVEDDRGRWCVTEKSLRSLQTATISLMFVQKHMIRKLTELGLDIDPINQQWDDSDWQVRQQSILDVLKRDTIHLDIVEQNNRCNHNKNLLLSWQKKYQKPNFFEAMAEEIRSA